MKLRSGVILVSVSIVTFVAIIVFKGASDEGERRIESSAAKTEIEEAGGPLLIGVATPDPQKARKLAKEMVDVSKTLLPQILAGRQR
jgi:hypothetical protein